MVWSAININFRSQLVILHGNVTDQRYIDDVLQSVYFIDTAAQPKQDIICSVGQRACTHFEIGMGFYSKK